jgi:hypothetical protein
MGDYLRLGVTRVDRLEGVSGGSSGYTDADMAASPSHRRVQQSELTLLGLPGYSETTLSAVRQAPGKENERMAKPMFYLAATYDSPEDATADLAAVKALHAAKQIGLYDAAIISKDPQTGQVQVTKTEKPTQHGAW